jgi:hypothetical protein
MAAQWVGALAPGEIELWVARVAREPGNGAADQVSRAVSATKLAGTEKKLPEDPVARPEMFI